MIAADEIAAPALAFDAVAQSFDERFAPWLSVAAQRRSVRRALIDAFPVGSRLVDVGGGTGDDACWLMGAGRDVLLTDASPAMVDVAATKLALRGGGEARCLAAERIGELAMSGPFDGAYSNFAALNCVRDLGSFSLGIAGMLRPGAPVLLVIFGTCCPGEMIVEALRGRPRNMLRRFRREEVEARLGGRDFTVKYHRAAELRRAMAPWFDYGGRRAIGLFIPPSAAEPWISKHPHLLRSLERADRLLSRPLAMFGDHILYRFSRNGRRT